MGEPNICRAAHGDLYGNCNCLAGKCAEGRAQYAVPLPPSDKPSDAELVKPEGMEDTAAVGDFIDWLALHNFGTEGWPPGSFQRMVLMLHEAGERRLAASRLSVPREGELADERAAADAMCAEAVEVTVQRDRALQEACCLRFGACDCQGDGEGPCERAWDFLTSDHDDIRPADIKARFPKVSA